MNRSRMRTAWRYAAVAAIAVGLLAGPAAAACTACCPTSDVSRLAAAPSCCGDCDTSMTRSPDAASEVIKSAAAPFPVLLAAAPAAPEPATRPASHTLRPADARVRSGPGSASTPLRL